MVDAVVVYAEHTAPAGEVPELANRSRESMMSHSPASSVSGRASNTVAHTKPENLGIRLRKVTRPPLRA